MKDVAARAGVSLSTVSYVLSGTRPISEPTKALILKAMDELNFQPNAVARALASKRSRVIALLLSPHARGLGLSELEFVKGAADAARGFDHHLVLLTEGMDSEADLAFLKGQGLVDGVILMEVRLGDPRVDLLQNLGLPFSLIGGPGPAYKLPYVDIDFDKTFVAVVDHLTGLGHRRVGFVNQSGDSFAAGYGPVVRAQEALDRWGAAAGWDLVSEFSAASPRDGFAACQRLFAQGAAPTALVVMNDQALPGVLQALAARNLRVPDDVSVVSVLTSSHDAARMMPALTSADVPSHDLARLAVGNLIRTLDAPHAGLETVLLPCLLTVRESTARNQHREPSSKRSEEGL
jgi:DNA-binding LacI/PurR family transcriptional regulator